MTIEGLNVGIYSSPFGANAIKRQIAANSIPNTNENGDSFVTKNKKKDNTLSVVVNTLLAAATVFGIYKGRNHIKSAYDFGKQYANKAVNYIQQNGAMASVISGAKKLGTNIQNGFSNLKNNNSNTSLWQKVKGFPSTLWGGIKTIASKIHK